MFIIGGKDPIWRGKPFAALPAPSLSVPPAPLVDQSAIYFDHSDAPAGNVASLTTRGSLGLTYTDALAPSATTNAMEADGLRLNGNVLRNSSAIGSFHKMTILLDVTRLAAPTSGAGELIAINSNGAAAVRFWVRYTTNGFTVVGPNSVAISMAPIGSYGDRQVIGAELDLTAGMMTAIEVDGEVQQVSVATGPIAITRIEIGKSCVAKIHELAVILEA